MWPGVKSMGVALSVVGGGPAAASARCAALRACVFACRVQPRFVIGLPQPATGHAHGKETGRSAKAGCGAAGGVALCGGEGDSGAAEGLAPGAVGPAPAAAGRAPAAAARASGVPRLESATTAAWWTAASKCVRPSYTMTIGGAAPAARAGSDEPASAPGSGPPPCSQATRAAGVVHARRSSTPAVTRHTQDRSAGKTAAVWSCTPFWCCNQLRTTMSRPRATASARTWAAEATRPARTAAASWPQNAAGYRSEAHGPAAAAASTAAVRSRREATSAARKAPAAAAAAAVRTLSSIREEGSTAKHRHRHTSARSSSHARGRPAPPPPPPFPPPPAPRPAPPPTKSCRPNSPHGPAAAPSPSTPQRRLAGCATSIFFGYGSPRPAMSATNSGRGLVSRGFSRLSSPTVDAVAPL